VSGVNKGSGNPTAKGSEAYYHTGSNNMKEKKGHVNWDFAELNFVFHKRSTKPSEKE